MRQMKFADHDFDVDAEIVFAAEDFDDASAGILRGGGPVGDFDVDDYAFEIVPVGRGGRLRRRERGLLISSFVRLSCSCESSNLLTTAGTEGTGESLGYSIPVGITISCVIFASRGLT